jgi:hypothetical protein
LNKNKKENGNEKNDVFRFTFYSFYVVVILDTMEKVV